ncbi:hypothetical protein TSUD_49510 [Trifolium subterraneum]|uniref:Uncharacterized protein n=1 Tax=Trifolium subterraneum TaxID=3900 RepID=A0A2Z6P2F6_TRISU|nr:hypothetical protein TSUD_49510 [Trifolium subterraneum]
MNVSTKWYADSKILIPWKVEAACNCNFALTANLIDNTPWFQTHGIAQTLVTLPSGFPAITILAISMPYGSLQRSDSIRLCFEDVWLLVENAIVIQN